MLDLSGVLVGGRNVEHDRCPIASARPRDLRLVTIDCPLESWQQPAMRRMFEKMVALKLSGFGARYDGRVLPVDTTDFVGHHFLSCIETPSGLQPVGGFRTIDLARCQSYNLPFPAIPLAMSANAPGHAARIAEFVEEDPAVSYVGSLTLDPRVERNRPLQQALLRRHFALGCLLMHNELDIRRIVLGATLRFKVDRLARSMGFQAFRHRGLPLAPIHVRHLSGEAVGLMYLDRYCPARLAQAQDLRTLWRNRVAY